jgi:hypothetical protein
LFLPGLRSEVGVWGRTKEGGSGYTPTSLSGFGLN